jgi:hypothetical protein
LLSRIQKLPASGGEFLYSMTGTSDVPNIDDNFRTSDVQKLQDLLYFLSRAIKILESLSTFCEKERENGTI